MVSMCPVTGHCSPMCRTRAPPYIPSAALGLTAIAMLSFTVWSDELSDMLFNASFLISGSEGGLGLGARGLVRGAMGHRGFIQLPSELTRRHPFLTAASVFLQVM